MLVILRKLFLVLLPLLVMAALYLILDPFEVVRHHRRYYNDPRVYFNWDYNQTEVLRNCYAEHRFDSYVLGSSRSKTFLAEDWAQHIDSKRVFHYAAAAETLFGMEAKLRFIDRHGWPLRNCLLVLDGSLLGATWNSTGHLFIKHPEVSGGSWIEFHETMFRAFINPQFFGSYLAYKLHLPERFISRKALFTKNGSQYDPIMGDLAFMTAERQILTDEAGFYNQRKNTFPPRPVTAEVSAPVIGAAQQALLRSMAEIFARHGTNVKVVINPLYDQKQLNPADVAAIRTTFGRGNVFDYSGINRFTADVHNYYETSHFRIGVARSILDEIYGATRNVETARGGL